MENINVYACYHDWRRIQPWQWGRSDHYTQRCHRCGVSRMGGPMKQTAGRLWLVGWLALMLLATVAGAAIWR